MNLNIDTIILIVLIMDDIIIPDKNPIDYLITPITPYFLCDHFVSTEVHKSSNKFIEVYLLLKANDLFENKNYNDIKNFDIIQVQVDYFDFFYYEILPIINKRNIKVILITSQWHFSQINQNDKTDDVLNDDNILLWISQNPIYVNNPKYMAFPYGICHTKVNKYVDFIKSNNVNNAKKNKIVNQYVNYTNHLLLSNHIRKRYDILGKNTGKERLSYTDFLTNILNSEFVISTSGDRDDCHRHYECIGLNSIPVSNINGGYKDIFKENMLYSNAEEMIDMVNSSVVNYEYKIPDRNILTIAYWELKIKQKINSLISCSYNLSRLN